jgi:hypothetical protein
MVQNSDDELVDTLYYSKQPKAAFIFPPIWVIAEMEQTVNLCMTLIWWLKLSKQCLGHLWTLQKMYGLPCCGGISGPAQP